MGVRDPEPHAVSQKIAVCGGGGGDNRAQRRQDSRICSGWGEWEGFKGPPPRVGMGCVLPWARRTIIAVTPRGACSRGVLHELAAEFLGRGRGVSARSPAGTGPVSPGPGERRAGADWKAIAQRTTTTPPPPGPLKLFPPPPRPPPSEDLEAKAAKRRRLLAAGWGCPRWPPLLPPRTRLHAGALRARRVLPEHRARALFGGG